MTKNRNEEKPAVEVSKTGLGIGTWMPQLFFDVIGRVIPGALCIGSLTLALIGPEQFWNTLHALLDKPSKSYPSLSVFFGAGLVLSYTLAVILWGLWHVLSLLVRKSMRENNREPETGIRDEGGDFSMKYDFIKLMNPTAGNRITKLKAEIHMAGVLILGFSLSLLINLLKLILGFVRAIRTDFSRLRDFFDISAISQSLFNFLDVQHSVLGILLLVAIAGSTGAWLHFRRRMNTAVQNNAILLDYEKIMSEKKAAS